MRLVGSDGAGLFTSISAGIGALSSPAGGGANSALMMTVMNELKASGADPRG